MRIRNRQSIEARIDIVGDAVGEGVPRGRVEGAYPLHIHQGRSIRNACDANAIIAATCGQTCTDMSVAVDGLRVWGPR